jgi:hypothetical protein
VWYRLWLDLNKHDLTLWVTHYVTNMCIKRHLSCLVVWQNIWFKIEKNSGMLSDFIFIPCVFKIVAPDLLGLDQGLEKSCPFCKMHVMEQLPPESGCDWAPAQWVACRSSSYRLSDRSSGATVISSQSWAGQLGAFAGPKARPVLAWDRNAAGWAMRTFLGVSQGTHGARHMILGLTGILNVT